MRSVEKNFSNSVVLIALVLILGRIVIITKEKLPLVRMKVVKKLFSKSPVPIALVLLCGRTQITNLEQTPRVHTKTAEKHFRQSSEKNNLWEVMWIFDLREKAYDGMKEYFEKNHFWYNRCKFLAWLSHCIGTFNKYIWNRVYTIYLWGKVFTNI